MLFCPLSQNITARRHYVSLVCMYTIHKYVLIQSGTQTWDLSKNLHDRILALPLSLPVSLWLSMALSGSLWLPLWLPLALSGSHCLSPCLSMALYGSLQLPLWLSLALSGSYWLSVTPTLVPTDSHRHSLAYSGRLLLSNFAYTVFDRLSGSLLSSQRRCHAYALCPGLFII